MHGVSGQHLWFEKSCKGVQEPMFDSCHMFEFPFVQPNTTALSAMVYLGLVEPCLFKVRATSWAAPVVHGTEKRNLRWVEPSFLFLGAHLLSDQFQTEYFFFPGFANLIKFSTIQPDPLAKGTLVDSDSKVGELKQFHSAFRAMR
jgi:hypothetical protein